MITKIDKTYPERENNNNIRLYKLKEIIDAAVKKIGKKSAKFCVVEFWLGDEMLDLESIGQFGIVPDVVIELKHE